MSFMVGLPLEDDTLLLVIQKSVRIRGLSEAVFHRFAQSMRGQYAFLNGGSDAGSDSLRFHKEHLGPCRMLKTYGAFLPGNLLEAQRLGG